jgi:hypothetical protein
MTDLSEDLEAVASTPAPATSTADMHFGQDRAGDYQGVINVVNELSIQSSSPADRERTESENLANPDSGGSARNHSGHPPQLLRPLDQPVRSAQVLPNPPVPSSQDLVGVLSDGATTLHDFFQDEKYQSPKIFDGKHEELESFIRACRHATSHPLFIDEQLKISYVFGYLTSAPREQAMPRFSATNSELRFETVQQLYDLLDCSFGFHMSEQEAQRAMLTCDQENRPFQEYHDEMFRYAGYAGAYGRDRDGGFRFLFEEGLSHEIQDRLIDIKSDMGFPEYSLNELVAWCKECDAHLRHLEEGLRLDQAREYSVSRSLDTKRAIPAISGRTKLSAEEKERRITLELCLDCGKPWHLSRWC